MYQDKLAGLKKEIIDYAALIETMIKNSVMGLLHNNRALLDGVINVLEPRANDRENGIDELCTSLIAQHQPAARDLRTILMVYRMNSDLERMGDHAVNIAESAIYLIERPPVKPFVDLPGMGELVTSMVKGSIDAFVRDDVEQAVALRGHDRAVDELRAKSIEELTACMMKDPATIERSLQIIRILSNLERIADLSTNIGEDVSFMVEGRVMKHHKDEIEQA
jgi:phosphate transport system protein